MSAIIASLSNIAFHLGLLFTRFGLKALSITVVAGLFIALAATILSQVDTITQTVPPELFVLWGLLAPNNALTCVTIIVGTKVSLMIYFWVSAAIYRLTNV